MCRLGSVYRQCISPPMKLMRFGVKHGRTFRGRNSKYFKLPWVTRDAKIRSSEIVTVW